jgi:DNA-binding FadR family transcriptional regulator
VDKSIFTPVKPKTAFDETLHRLRNAIKLGLLPPGSRLPAERELCTQLGISRSTLRQALMALTGSGYLHATRGRGGGTFVVDALPAVEPPTAAQLACWREVADERLAIELGVVVLAATRAAPASVAPLQKLASEMEPCFDPVRLCQLDRQFHIAIAELTESRRLTIASTGVQASVFDLMSTIEPTAEQREIAMAGHRAIIQTLIDSDGQAAIAAMRTHLGHTKTLFDSELAQGSATTASAAT